MGASDPATGIGADPPTATGMQRPAAASTPAQRARRERIVRAAQALLEERPYDQIQIRDISEKADVALGTLYRYFPSKELLFAHVLLEWSASFDVALRQRHGETASDADRLRQALRRAAGAFERYENFFALIDLLEVSKDPEVMATFTAYRSRFTDALTQVLVDTDPDDVEVLTELVSSLLGSLLRDWSQGQHSMTAVTRRIDRAVDIVFDGVRSR